MIDQPLSKHSQAQLPRGVADYFWDEALQRRRIESTLLETFRCWGYSDVISPTFEYAETLSARASSKLQSDMYRLLDRDGSTLSLRADMTIPVARLVSTRLHDQPMPQRYCYAGNVFRYAEPQAGRQREFWQAGVELIGASAPAADAEVLALTARALDAVGITDYRFVIGQMRYFTGLLHDLDLEMAERQALLAAIDRNSAGDLADFLRAVPLRDAQKAALERLPDLSGGNAQQIIAEASQVCLNQDMRAALENLSQITEILDEYGIAERVFLDLTEIHDLGYYSGITFEVLVPQLGFAIGSGGRYDDLLATFGTAQPAVGVALGIDRVLLARQLHAPTSTSARPVAPQVLVYGDADRVWLRVVEQWRSQGIRVAVDVLDLQDEDVEARQMAHMDGAPCVLFWRNGGFDIYGGADSNDPRHGCFQSLDVCAAYISSRFAAQESSEASV